MLFNNFSRARPQVRWGELDSNESRRTVKRFLLLFILAATLFPSITYPQQAMCPDTCGFEEAESFITYNEACYDCSVRELNLTPVPGTCSGAIYRDSTQTTLRGSLDLRSGFRLPLQLNFGDREDGREGLAFLFIADSSLVIGPGGGYMGYENIPGSIGFIFDVHQNAEPPFSETENYDNFRLVTNGMLGERLYGPVAIKPTHRNGFENVEDGQDVNALITYDAELKLLEMHVNRFHRMTYRIDLEEYFGIERIYAAALGCNDVAVGVNYSIGISDNNVLFNASSRDFTSCGASNSWLNWVHRSPPDNNSWNISGIDFDRITQERNGSPGFLGTHFPLIEAEASVFISPQPEITTSNGSVITNTDRDMFGVGIGFRQPYAQFQDGFEGILLDWKGDQVLGSSPVPQGFFLSRLAGQVAPAEPADENISFATRAEENGYSIMDSLLAPPWDTGKTYEFRIRYTSNRIQAEVIDTATATVLYAFDGPHDGDPGAFVIYNYSQPGILYDGFSYRLLHTFSMNRDTICPGENVFFSYDASATPRLPEVLRDAYWEISNGDRIAAFADGETISPLTYTFDDCGDQNVTLFVVDSSGCPHPFTRTIHVREAAKIRLQSDTTLCAGESLLLIPDLNADTVLWQDGSLNRLWLVNEPGEYIAISRDSLVCPSRDTIVVDYAPPIDYELNITPDCPRGEEGTIEVSPVPPTNQLVATLNGDTSLLHTNLIAGNYTIEILDAAGCSTDGISFSVPIGISSPPDVSVTDALCFGGATGAIRLGQSTNLVATLNDVTDTVFTNLLNGDYLVIFTDPLGCTLEETFTVGAPPPLRILGVQDTTIFPGQALKVRPLVSNGTLDSLSWTPGFTPSAADSGLFAVAPLATTTYLLEVTNSAGCRGDTLITVSVSDAGGLYVPNVFSPNFDGSNDYFYPLGGAVTAGVAAIKLTVYNRFGGVVFQSPEGALPDDPTFGWDGTNAGTRRHHSPLRFVYLLKITWIDGRTETKTGTVQIMR